MRNTYVKRVPIPYVSMAKQSSLVRLKMDQGRKPQSHLTSLVLENHKLLIFGVLCSILLNLSTHVLLCGSGALKSHLLK